MILVVFSTLAMCSGAKQETSPVITLVSIGDQHGRMGLGEELRILNQHNAKIIAFNFILDNDSLEVDSLLVSEMAKNRNIVMCNELKNYDHNLNLWNSVISSHPKFKTQAAGFSNFNMSENDCVLIRELPMRQMSHKGLVKAFSYVVAEKSFGVKEQYNTFSGSDFIFNLDAFGPFFKIISYDDLLTGKFNPADITDKIVIIGFMETEYVFYLNESHTKHLTGTEIQACFIKELLRQ